MINGSGARCLGLLLAALALSALAACERAPAPKADPHAGHAHGAGEHERDQGAAKPIGPETSAVPIDMSKGWCTGHGVPESVCTRCDESLIERFKAGKDWCAGHKLPESQCEACNPGVTAAWAKLNPDAPAGGPAAPPSDLPAESATGMRIERILSPLSAANDPLCKIDQLRVRFVDGAVSRKAGIEVAPVVERRLAETIETPATVTFDPTRVARVSAGLPGVVKSVAVRLGDEVAAGDVLMELESSALGEAKAAAIEARERFDLALLDAERAARIAEGAARMLAALREDIAPQVLRERLEGIEVGEARGRLTRAHADLRIAMSQSRRERQLLEQRISSAQDVERADAALATAEAEFVAAREEIAFTVERERVAAERGAQSARVALDSAERRLRILGLTAPQIAGLREEDPSALTRLALRSPLAGRVIELRRVAGETTGEGDELAVVADTSAMQLELALRESELPLVRVGQALLFMADNLPGMGVDAKISWISARVDPQSRVVAARADLTNADGVLRDQMFGRARIVIASENEVLTVPAPAIQTDGCCQLVFVRQSDELYEPRKVALGVQSGGYREVRAGLRAGEMVATTGSFLMKTELLKDNIGAGCCEVEPGR